MVARVLLITAVVAVAFGWASPAVGHGVSATADVHLAQTIAGNELTVVIRSTPAVPGPLRVDLIAYQPVRDVTVHLTVAGPGRSRAATDTVELETGRAGTYESTLNVGRAGAHRLELRAADETSILPFRVLVSRAADWELLTYGGFGCAAVLLVGALLAGATHRRIPAVTLGGGATLALVVALTVALLSARLPPGQPDGARESVPTDPADGSAALGRPYAQVAAGTAPAIPRTGEKFALRLDLTDGSTGRAVDDLVVHHAAVAHLVVTSQDGEFFRHVHPRRTAAGRLEVALTVNRPGRYLVWAEFERADSGGQLGSAEFRVTGDVTDEARPADADAAVTVSPERAIAGRPTTIDLDTGPDDLQPWLGMAGHLIARDQAGGFLGHVHEQDSMSAQDTASAIPDATVAAYGPRLRFTFSFPKPGRYLVWVQFARDFRIHTVPVTVDVIEETT